MLNNNHPVVYVNSLSVIAKEKKLIDDISFSLYAGDVLGLIGETCSGKTVLINALGMNSDEGLTTRAEEFRYHINNEDIHLLDKTEDELSKLLWGEYLTFILSNARSRFNPIMTVGEQFSDIIKSNFHLNDEEASDKAKKMLNLVQMPDSEQNYKSYPHELSGGMIQRVEIAIALSASPKVLLADEPTMGLDVTIQRQILDLMDKLLRQTSSCVVIATRDLGIVANYCNKIAVLQGGNIIEFTDVREFFAKPRHPYSKYLLDLAVTSYHKDALQKKTTVDDEVSSLGGCFWYNSCEVAEKRCALGRPETKYFSDDSYVMCNHFI